MGLRGLLRGIPVAVYVLVAIGAAAGIVYGVAPEQLQRVAQEDGPVEYGQALVLLAGAVFFFVPVARRRGRDPWGLVLGLGLFVVAGEEISWGQRLLGIETPERIRSSNLQGEFNLHNIEGIHQNVRALGMVAIVGLFVLIPLARLGWARLARLEARLGIPPVPLWVIPLALVALAFMVVPRVVSGEVFELDEVGELFIALTAAVYGWSAMHRPVPAEPVIDLTERPVTPADVAVSA